jgi:hypothetical protein
MLEVPEMPSAAAEAPEPQQKFEEISYPAEQAPLGDKAVQVMAENLKRDGRNFELSEEGSDYVLRVEGIEGTTHVAKNNEDVKGIIFAQIVSPERD